MKKLTHQQVASFIKSGTLSCHDENGTVYTGGIRYLSEKEINSITDFPKQLKYFIENPHIQYLVPDSIYLFSPYEIIKHRKLFISWLEAAKKVYFDEGDYRKRQDMLKIGLHLLSLVCNEHENVCILSKPLWNNFSFGYQDKIPVCSNQFSQLFETVDEVIEFQSILPDDFKVVNNKTRRNTDNNILYYTYLKAVTKVAPDNSIPIVPLILRSRLQQSTAESCHLEVLNVLHKYKFSAAEDIIRRFYNTSSNMKIVEKAKEILIKNNALQPQTKIILSEEDSIVYHKIIEVNLLALKEQTNDNLLVTHTLINLIHHYLQTKFFIFKKNSAWTVEFEIRTNDPNDLPIFKQQLEKCLRYTFDIFLTPQIYQQFSETKRGNRIFYENTKKIQTAFKSGFDNFCIQESLQKQLSYKEQKEKIQKI